MFEKLNVVRVEYLYHKPPAGSLVPKTKHKVHSIDSNSSPLPVPPFALRPPSVLATPNTKQLLRFIVSANNVNLMHKDMKIENLFVRHAENPEIAELAVGDFGATQRGEVTVSGVS